MAANTNFFGDYNGPNFSINSTEAVNLLSYDDFKFQTNNKEYPFVDYGNEQNAFSAPYTLDSLGISAQTTARTYLDTSNKIFLNFDKTNISNYAYFGSLREKIVFSIKNIIYNWPASLPVNQTVDGVNVSSVYNFSYDAINNESTFQVPTRTLNNKFSLNYTQNTIPTSAFTETEELRNLNISYEKYVVFINEIEYPVVGFTGSPQSNAGLITVKALGNPFTAFTGSRFSVAFHIKPSLMEFKQFYYGQLTDLERYLLNVNSNPLFTSTFKFPVENDNGFKTYETRTFTWTRSDGYNIDFQNEIPFITYVNDLTELADGYDNFKTNIIYSQLVAPAVSEFDETADARFYKLLQTYGYGFDSVKTFIDSLSYLNRVTYNGTDNLPNKLVKQFAKTLGWGVLANFNQSNLLNASFGKSNETNTANDSDYNDLTPAEIDIEFWRRIVINTAWMFKSKGTRKAIEFMFRLIGTPECLIEFDEHVYTIDNKLDKNTAQNIINTFIEPSLSPVDRDGYPQIIPNNQEYYFQTKGGWYKQINLINDNVDERLGIHFGNYDRGQSYYDPFREAGFNVVRQVDNKKSWTNSGASATTKIDTGFDTEYTVQDERLVLNSKEISLSLDIAGAIECDVYNCNSTNNYPISTSGVTGGYYPQNKYTNFSVSTIPFSKYIENVLSGFIDAKNRKVIDDAHGGGYPTLTQLYKQYYEYTNCSALSYDSVQDYIQLFDGYWMDLIAQLIPATTIFAGTGEKWRNTVFHPQKFVYKRGINDGSEFSNVVKINPDLAAKKRIIKVQARKTTSNYGKVGVLEFNGTITGISYPCINSGSTSYSHYKRVDDTVLGVFIGGWDSVYSFAFGPLCPQCEIVYAECSEDYFADDYTDCTCYPVTTCATEYVVCDYVGDDYVE